MSEFVQPNRIFQVNVPDIPLGELLLSPGHDFMHHFQPLGCYVLKYMNQTETGTTNHNVWLKPFAAEWMIEHCEIEVLERKHMRQEEWEQYLEYESETLSDTDFGLEGDGTIQ